jgi:protein gp37
MLDYISRSAFLSNAPLLNVWLGISAEDQKSANSRIPLLLETPAAVRWVSLEPLLEKISLDQYYAEEGGGCYSMWLDHLDWIVVGGESGPGARPMHPNWARSLRDQCRKAEVPFFFKQWGDWSPNYPQELSLAHRKESYFDKQSFYRVGKKFAGRVLDSQTWSEYPS